MKAKLRAVGCMPLLGYGQAEKGFAALPRFVRGGRNAKHPINEPLSARCLIQFRKTRFDRVISSARRTFRRRPSGTKEMKNSIVPSNGQ